MHKQKLLSFLMLLGLLFAVGFAVFTVRYMQTRGAVIGEPVAVPKEFSQQFARVTVKNRAEPITEVRFLTPEGKTVSWSHFDGEWLLVNFWATWCAPCVVELPSLDKFARQFDKKGLKVISVSLDANRTQEDIKKFLYNRNIGEFAAYWDNAGQIQRNIAMRGIPTTYLLDPKGNIRYIFEGDADWASPPAVTFFSNLLNHEP